MKKLILTQLMLLLFASVFFLSCGDDDEAPIVLLPKLDGFYVYGTNTVAEGPSDPNSRMALAILDHGKAPKVASEDGVFGKFIYIGANSKISFAEVVNEVGTIYGSVDAAVDNGADLGYSENDNVVHGSLAANATAISITNEGLYYVFVNRNTNLFIVMPVKANMIGDATPLSWDGATALPMKSTSKDVTVFEGTGIALLNEHGYRYRLNDGWHVYYEENVLHTLSSLGVAEVWVDAIAKDHNDIGFFLENAPHKVTGLYTVTLTYTASTGVWSEVKTKTGEVLIDYSNREVGFFGNAFYVSEGVEGTWTDQGGVKKPTKVGNVYTWTWDDFELIQDREFVIRQNGTWEGIQGLYDAGTSRAGTAFDTKVTKVEGDGKNFFVTVGGTYDISFSIDASNNVQTLTIN